MRWVSYQSERDHREHAALIADDGRLHAVSDTMLTILQRDGGSLAGAAETARIAPFEILDLDQAQLLAPIPQPPSVRDFMAFEDHVKTAMERVGKDVHPVWYEQPVFYFSNPAGVIGPADPVPVSPGSSMFDYELEIAAIVGKGGSDLDPATAEEHIAGYAILADWSARDLQMSEMAVGLGPAKAKDGATTIGPWLVTPDELAPYRDGNGFRLEMSASVNGRAYSRGVWSSVYWSFGQMLAYASRGTTLRPGDVIGSGTVGTGCILELSAVPGSQEYPWLAPGDQVTLEVDHLGRLSCDIVAGPDPVPLR